MAAELQHFREVSVLNIRIKFQKYGVMKFVGHLDMMRFFQKAIRRAGIDIAYSEGYSPHQIMSFAAPLGVGVSSDGEYFDIEVSTSKSSEEAVHDLNQAMVEGISVLEYKKLPDTAKSAMSLVAAADYFICEKPGYEPLFRSREELQEKIQGFYENQEEIFILKQTKKKEVEMNLKPLIYEMKLLDRNERNHPENEAADWGLFLKVCTGSSDNLKPELVLEAFCRFCQADYNPFQFQIHRLEVYAKSDDVPVKGEKERERYLNYLKRLKQSYKEREETFPTFLPLGELGENIENC